MARPFIPAVNTARLEQVFENDGVECANIFHVRFNSQPDESRLASLVEKSRIWMTDTWAGIAALQTVILRTSATDLTEEGGATFEYAAFGGATGTINALRLPNNVSLVIKWMTGFAGRSRRGRTYFIGLTGDARQTFNASHCTPEFAAVVYAVYDNLRSVIEEAGDGAVLSIASFREDNAWRETALVTPVTSLFVNTRFDTMRKRMPI